MPTTDFHNHENQSDEAHGDDATNGNITPPKSDADTIHVASVEAIQGEDDYDEDEDEDYNLESTKKEPGIDGDDEDDDQDDYIDVEDKKELAKYSAIESTEGGLIKTRRQRQEEEERERKQKKNFNSSQKRSETDINSIWEELKGSKSSKPAVQKEEVETTNISQATFPDKSIEKIKITRTYEFAGKQITEEKEVDINSEEAKAHLNSIKIKASNDVKPQPASSTPALRRKRKRASLLDAVISNSSSAKLSTLEKSRLDWATYVDKNKISDELKYKNKGGFLEKQDFLNRVDSKRENMFKDAKSKR